MTAVRGGGEWLEFVKKRQEEEHGQVLGTGEDRLLILSPERFFPNTLRTIRVHLCHFGKVVVICYSGCRKLAQV